MLQRAASNAYSWWWASHIRTKQSKWLDSNLQDMEHRVKHILLLLGEEADSFAKRAEMYYKRRPEVISSVEEAYRAYRALVERYDHISGELHKANHTIAAAFPDQVQYAMLEEEDDNLPKAFTPIDSRKIHKSTVEGLMKKRKEGQSGFKESGRNSTVPISKENVQEEINRLQKAILVMQTEKEFIKSCYESGIAKFWDLEKQINEMQEEVCYFQDEFSASAVIEDDEARALMTATALKSCEDAIVKLQEQQKQSFEQARKESERIKVAREKLKAIMSEHGKSLTNSANNSDGNTAVDCHVDMKDVYSMKKKLELQSIIDKIKQQFEMDSYLSVEEIAEKIDELVSKVVDLGLRVSSQTAQINRLCQENGELEKNLQNLEEEKTILVGGSGELNNKLEQAEKELIRVQTLETSFHDEERMVRSNIAEALSSFSDIAEMLQSPSLEHHAGSALSLTDEETAPIDMEAAKGHDGLVSENRSTDLSEKLHPPNSEDRASLAAPSVDEKTHNGNIDPSTEHNETQAATGHDMSENIVPDEMEKIHEPANSVDAEKMLALGQEENSQEKDSSQLVLQIPSNGPGDCELRQEEIRGQESSTSGELIPDSHSENIGGLPQEDKLDNENSTQASDSTAHRVSEQSKDQEDSQARVNSSPSSERAGKFGDEEADVNWQQLFMNGLEGREKVLLAEYTSILRNYKETKRRLTEVEMKNQASLHEMTGVISELSNANASKDEEIRLLRALLNSSKASPNGGADVDPAEKDASRIGHRMKPSISFAEKDAPRDGHQRMQSSFSSLHRRNRSIYVSKLIRKNSTLPKNVNVETYNDAEDQEGFRLEDLKLHHLVDLENISPLEEKFRMDIDALLEENLEFWLKFSASFQRIQEFQAKYDELQSEIEKLNDDKRESGHGSATDPTAKTESADTEKQLRALKTELQVWMEQNAMLKGELHCRFASLCNIQEEIAGALGTESGAEGTQFTSYQAAKFQGEVLNMQQENNKVADELQAGVDHIKGLQAEIEKALAKLHRSLNLSGPKSSHNNLRHFPSKTRIPLRSFLFPSKNKKPSLFACVNPALQKQQSDLRFFTKLE